MHLLLHETPVSDKKRTLEAFEVNHDYVFPEGSYANKLRSGAAADDILDSVFRGVQVSDSAPIDNDKLILTGRTLISPLSAARVEDFDGDAKDLPLYQECVRPGETIRFRLTLDQSILNRHTTPLQRMLCWKPSPSSAAFIRIPSCRTSRRAIPLQTSRTPRTSSLAAAPASSLKRSVTLT